MDTHGQTEKFGLSFSSKWLGAFLFLPLALILFYPYKSALVFEYEDSRKVLAYLPCEINDHFQIKFTHSIHLSDVTEAYKIGTNGDIIQKKISYNEFAVGMPSGPSEGETFYEEGGFYHLKMNSHFPYLDVRVATLFPDHSLIYKGGKYPLPKIAGKGNWTRIQYKKVSLWAALKGENLIGR